MIPVEPQAAPQAVSQSKPQGEPALAHEDETLRRCLLTRESHDKGQLLRFVVDPQGQIVPDIDGTLPGRGLWLTPTREMVAQAITKGAFLKAGKMAGKLEGGTKITCDPDLAERLGQMLRTRVLFALGLARRAGLVVSGFEKVAIALSKGRIAYLVTAGDAAPDGRDKLLSSARATSVPCLSSPFLLAEDLGAALGQDPRVHLGLKPGGASEKARRALSRHLLYEGLQTVSGAQNSAHLAP